MPTYITKLPQDETPSISVTIQDLIRILPETISYPLNVWVSGQLARFGRTSEVSVTFLVEVAEEPDTEMKLYFSGLVSPLGMQGTAVEKWKDNSAYALRLYNSGRLIVDKITFAYKEMPEPVNEMPSITVSEVLSSLPPTVQWTFPIYLTGGLTRNGWSNNDIDLIVFQEGVPASDLGAIRNFFTQTFGWKCDVGRTVMLPREPVYLYKLYDGGILQNPS